MLRRKVIWGDMPFVNPAKETNTPPPTVRFLHATLLLTQATFQMKNVVISFIGENKHHYSHQYLTVTGNCPRDGCSHITTEDWRRSPSLEP